MAESCGSGMKTVPVDLCISSPLCRALKTAEIVLSANTGYGQRAEKLLRQLADEQADFLQHTKPAVVRDCKGKEDSAAESGPGLFFLTDDRLVEASFGPWEGLICKAEGYNVPLEDFSTYWREPESPLIQEGVERLPKVAERVTAVLRDLTQAESLRDKTILLVVHGCVMRSVMYICGGRKSFTGKVPFNCEVIECEPVGRDGLKELSRAIYYDASMVHDYYATMKQE